MKKILFVLCGIFISVLIAGVILQLIKKPQLSEVGFWLSIVGALGNAVISVTIATINSNKNTHKDK